MAEEETLEDKRNDRKSYLKQLRIRLLGAGKARVDHASCEPYTGIHGSSTSTIGRGVSGIAIASSGENRGVFGQTNSPDGVGVYGIGLAATGCCRGVYGQSSSTEGRGVEGCAISTDGIGVMGRARSPRAIPIVAQGEAAQTANLQEWCDADRTALSVVDRAGRLGVGTAAPSYALDLRTPDSTGAQIHFASTNTDTGGYVVSTGDSNVFLSAGSAWNGTNWIAKATSACEFGGGVGGIRFYHDTGLTTSGKFTPTCRIIVQPSGNVGIGTESPAEKLHVVGNVKATGFVTGDVTFSNGIKVTEEGDGLAFLNDSGERIAALDQKGNFCIKGKLIEHTLHA